jgi:hypothetical protein
MNLLCPVPGIRLLTEPIWERRWSVDDGESVAEKLQKGVEIETPASSPRPAFFTERETTVYHTTMYGSKLAVHCEV